jgi:Tetracyclin repressor-like, C-terminal domain
LYVERWENMPPDDPWPALVRSALSHEPSRKLLQSELGAQRTQSLAKVLGETDEGVVRGAMVQCLLGGMIMERYIYQLEPSASIPVQTFEAALADCLQHAISGPLGSQPMQPGGES